MEKGVVAVRRLFNENTATGQARTMVVDIICFALERCCNRVRSEHPSCHAGCFKQTLIVGRQSLELTINQLLQSIRHTGGRLFCVTTETPYAVIGALEKSATDEFI